MKMWKSLVIVGASAALTVSGALAGTGLTGTPHDFRSKSWNASGEMCLPCHIPHGADITVDAPLWNHAHKASADYTLWDGATLGGESLTCLGCHDGQTALDSFSGVNGTTVMGAVASHARSVIGMDLTDDHPIGVKYSTSGGTRWGAITISTSGSASVLPASSVSTRGLSLYGADYRVECTTCHTPHDNSRDPHGHFLRFSNAGSELCLTCHISKR